MPRMIECTVVEPPTGGEVLQRAIGELSIGKLNDFRLLLHPTQEVPRSDVVDLDLHFHNLNMQFGKDDYNAVLTTTAVDNPDIVSVIVRIPHDSEAPAVATIVSQE